MSPEQLEDGALDRKVSPGTFQAPWLGPDKAVQGGGGLDDAGAPGSLGFLGPSSGLFPERWSLTHSPFRHDAPPPTATLKGAKSLEKPSSSSLSLQSCPMNTLPQCSPLHFAYIFLQPNSAFKDFLFHLLINFYLPRRREDSTGNAVCDVCCSPTALQMKFPLEHRGA